MGEVPQFVDNSETGFPAEIHGVEAYISADYARAERDRLWRKCWLQAGRLEDIPEVGNYITYDILDDSVLIARTVAAGWSIRPRASATPAERPRISSAASMPGLSTSPAQMPGYARTSSRRWNGTAR